MRLLLDPRLFSGLLILLMLLQAARWSWERRWLDVAYWLLSAGFVALVAFGYQK